MFSTVVITQIGRFLHHVDCKHSSRAYSNMCVVGTFLPYITCTGFRRKFNKIKSFSYVKYKGLVRNMSLRSCPEVVQRSSRRQGRFHPSILPWRYRPVHLSSRRISVDILLDKVSNITNLHQIPFLFSYADFGDFWSLLQTKYYWFGHEISILAFYSPCDWIQWPDICFPLMINIFLIKYLLMQSISK